MMRVLSILMVAVALATVASASDDEIFNVDLFCGWGGYYRPMEWMPAEVGVSSVLTEPFDGSVTVAAQQDGLNTMSVRYDDFVLTPDMPRNLPLVTKLAFAADKCTVTIRDKRGRKQWEREWNLWDYSSPNPMLTSITEKDMLIGLVGRGEFGLRQLPKGSVCQSAPGPGRVLIGRKLPQKIPWDWTGFVSLDLLILDNPDWTQFMEQQLKAIVEWVSNGGRLLIVLGSGPLAAGNPIGQFLPFELQEVRQTTLPTQTLEKWGLVSRQSESVAAWPLVPKPGARVYDIQTHGADECLFATAYAGFGRVSVLSFAPSTMSDVQTARARQFWIGRIREVLGDNPDTIQSSRNRGPRSTRMTRTIEPSSDPEGALGGSARNRRYRFDVGQAQEANNFVMEFLYEGIKPLSIWWVILLLTMLAVLLGPVDYKLLKRKGRLPLTWVTCTFWIALFTVGAYYGVQALRGGDMELKVVSVLDGIEDADHGWSTDYCGLFAPYSDDYRLSGLQQKQWWSGISPTQHSIQQYNREAAGRKIYCLQHDGGNVPYSLPINIWTIQCLLNESRVEKLPFTAEVRHEGEEVVVSISNESDSPILGAKVFLENSRGADLGQVPAGETVEFRKKPRSLRLWGSYDQGRYQNPSQGRNRYQGNYMGRFERDDAFFAQGCLQRTRAMSDYLARGAALVCAEYDQAPVSFAVEGHSSKPTHVQLARLVVFPKEQREETAND